MEWLGDWREFARTAREFSGLGGGAQRKLADCGYWSEIVGSLTVVDVVDQ